MGKKGGGRVRVKQVGPKMPANMNPLADLAIPPDEMINLPVKPDSNSGFLFWPVSESAIMIYDKFNTIYPNYLDSNKTHKLGRRIATKDAVPEPTLQDIHEALVQLDIRHVIQPYKGYSRDAAARWDNNGRVLVDLKGAVETGVLGMEADGAFDLDNVPDMDEEKENEGCGVSKKQFLKQLARTINGLPGRQRRLEEKAKLALKEEAEKSKVVAPSAAPSSSAGNRKKKGKKGKK